MILVVRRVLSGVVMLLPFVAAIISESCKQYDTQSPLPDISTTASPLGTCTFKPDSASLAQNYNDPEWFRDSKFGIFIHWGVYSVPAYGGEWYARFMYKEGSDINRYHVAKYGKLTEFGYKDFIPMFTAEKFDADEWMKIIKQSGAKYVVPVAEHHDGFAMYRSAANEWNAAYMGPKRDVIGELKEAAVASGLKFGVSSHRSENAWFYEYGMLTQSDVNDLSITLYGERLRAPYSGDDETQTGSNEHSRKQFLIHTYELVDRYQPDLMWFDWNVGLPQFRPIFYKFLAYYYNNAIDWRKDVVVNTKFGYGDNIQVYDIARGKSDRIREFPWQTDTSIGKKAWGYRNDEENKSPDHIIDDLVDIVSKNGNLLLNIGPKADGTIPAEQAQVLAEIGEWLAVNGEAIYGTRPWVKAAEGPHIGTAATMADDEAGQYTGEDIRFTAKGAELYAIFLKWPGETALVRSLASGNADMPEVHSVEMLGSGEKLQWKQTPQGLMVRMPEQAPTDYAHAIRIR